MRYEQYPLYDLAEWKNGLAFRKIHFSNTGRPIIKIAELKNGITSSTSLTQGEYDSAIKLQKGDMLFSWSGNPETSIDVFWYSLPDGWLNQHIFKVNPKNVIDRKYFYYLLKYLKPTFTAIASNKQTTGLGHVTIKDLKKILIDLPPFSVQLAIGNYLSVFDDKIELNQRINDNWDCPILREVIPCHRALTKSSKSLENKGFFAVSSPYPFIRFHTLLPLLWQLIRAKARERKSCKKI